jgi:hypothetical protein
VPRKGFCELEFGIWKKRLDEGSSQVSSWKEGKILLKARQPSHRGVKI